MTRADQNLAAATAWAGRHRFRRAFTLLEMLLALALTGLLMAGLFAVLRFQTRVANRGSRAIEQAQLARALLELIAGDIRASVPPLASWRSDQRLSKQAALNAGIVGNASQIVLSPHRPLVATPATAPLATGLPAVSLADQLGAVAAEPAKGTLSRTGLAHRPQAGFEQVVYTLLRPAAASVPGQPAPQAQPAGTGAASAPVQRLSAAYGLVRIQLSSNGRADAETQAAVQRRSIRWQCRCGCGRWMCFCAFCGLSDLLAKPAQSDEESFEAGQVNLALQQNAQVIAPEVRQLRFRYHGDWGWQDSWTGRSDLPVAVQIEIELAEPVGPESEQPRPAAQTPSAAEDQDLLVLESLDEIEAGEAPSDRSVPAPKVRTYRLVVRIPAGPEAKPASALPLTTVPPRPLAPASQPPAPAGAGTGWQCPGGGYSFP